MKPPQFTRSAECDSTCSWPTSHRTSQSAVCRWLRQERTVADTLRTVLRRVAAESRLADASTQADEAAGECEALRDAEEVRGGGARCSRGPSRTPALRIINKVISEAQATKRQ